MSIIASNSDASSSKTQFLLLLMFNSPNHYPFKLFISDKTLSCRVSEPQRPTLFTRIEYKSQGDVEWVSLDT